MRLFDSVEFSDMFFQDIAHAGFFLFVISRYKDRFLFFYFPDDLFLYLYQFGEGDPIVDVLHVLFDDNDQILEVRLSAYITFEHFEQLHQ